MSDGNFQTSSDDGMLLKSGYFIPNPDGYEMGFILAIRKARRQIIESIEKEMIEFVSTKRLSLHPEDVNKNHLYSHVDSVIREFFTNKLNK